MEHIKQNFSIGDLEHLSGIKAHTIRIWEKRYNILNPNRTDTNIRLYSSENLQKLLNISFLNENGYKISRISKLNEEEINTMVKRISASASEESRAINAFKMAMLNFDEQLFKDTYEKLTQKKSFNQIFYDVFIPFLEEIGLLWQTNTIQPVHEHYIVELIKQRIYIKISELKFSTDKWDDTVYVLFLPKNEIHDIGILYLNFELLQAGKNAIYLGSSLPMDNLKTVTAIYKDVCFLSYLTISPVDTNVQEFISEYQEIIGSEKKLDLHLFGGRVNNIDRNLLPENVKIYDSIANFTKKL